MAESKADQLKRYKQRLSASRKKREKDGYDDLWRRMIDLYAGKHFPAGLGQEDRIAVNVAFATVNVVFPSVTVNYPKVSVWARKPEDDDRAHILEAVVNYWWKHYRIKQEFRRAAKDFLIIGHGWVKCGYRYTERTEQVGDDDYGSEFDDLRAQVDEFAEQHPEMAGDLPTDEQIAANIPATKAVAVEDRPYAERVSPFDIFVDPEATSMNDLKWIAQRVVRPLEDVKRDRRYSAAARKRIEADVQQNPKWRDDDRAAGDDVKRVTTWEFYDLRKNWLCVFAESGDKFLVDPQPMPYEFGHPFVMLRNYDVPDEFYPMGDLEALEPLQHELNKTRSQMMNHRKRYARKYLYREESFGPEGRAALEDETDNRMVPVTDDRPFADVVAPMPISALPPEFYNYTAQTEDDMDKVSGINEYMRGTLPEIRRTATEASIIQDAANSRAADKLAVVEDTIADVAARLVGLAQQFLTGDQVVRVIGTNGHPVWVPFERDDIQGEFDFEVEAGSTQPRNEAFRQQQAMNMLQALAPFIGTVLNPVEIMAHVLQFGFGLKNPQKFLQAQPGHMAGLGAPEEDPMAALMAAGGGGAPGADAVPPELLAQLQGQVGFDPVTLTGRSEG